jgi:hypothetical protein
MEHRRHALSCFDFACVGIDAAGWAMVRNEEDHVGLLPKSSCLLSFIRSFLSCSVYCGPLTI